MQVGDDQIAGSAGVAVRTSAGKLPSPGAAGADPDELLRLAACHDLALEVARMATFELDASSGQLSWSPAAATVMGCAADQVEGHLRELLAPMASAATVSPADFEIEQHIVAGGDERFVQVRARGWPSVPRLDRVGMFGVVTDVTGRRHAEQELVDQMERYRLLVELSPDAIAVHQDGVVRYVNTAACHMARASADEVVGSSILRFVPPEDVSELLARLVGLTKPGLWAGPTRTTVLAVDGTPITVEAVSVRTSWKGRPAYQLILRDMTEHDRAEAERVRAEARFSTVVSALDEGIAVIGTDGRIQSLNPAAERILGLPASDAGRAALTGAGLDACDEHGRRLHAEDWPVQEVLTTGRHVRDRTVGVRRPDGTFAWLRVNAHPLDDGTPDRPMTAVVWAFADVTESRRTAIELAYTATHDALTGLPNRTAMLTEIDAALERAHDHGGDQPVTVLFFDLDRFREVNDSLGHPAGDSILCEVADRLRQWAPPGTSVGRLAGDEFVVVAPDVGEDAAAALARDLMARLRRPIGVDVHGAPMSVTIASSAGVASTAAHASLSDGVELLRAADVALFRAKAQGRNRVERFDPSIPDSARLRLELREDLRRALETGALEVNYQPLWRASADPSTCQVAGFEALARWDHPVRGRQNPADFIALAEETGLIGDLGAYVLDRACHQTARWRAEGRDLYVSVNLSARQLSDPDLATSVAATLARYGLPAEALWLELTESALADEDIDAGAVLGDLVAMGVRISIDDFGTGYSSLGRLHRLPIGALKIDRSFVADMTTAGAPDGRGASAAIVESTVALAHQLGLAVIAEGVETPAQLGALAGLRCELVQGYLLGRPVPAGEVVFAPAGAERGS